MTAEVKELFYPEDIFTADHDIYLVAGPGWYRPRGE
jgi:hypothetical protein